MLKRIVPRQFHDLIRAFSKADLNKLPPYRLYDYKIKLTKDVPLSYYPLYY